MTKLKAVGMSCYDVLVNGQKVGHVSIVSRFAGGGWMYKRGTEPAARARTRAEAVEQVTRGR